MDELNRQMSSVEADIRELQAEIAAIYVLLDEREARVSERFEAEMRYANQYFAASDKAIEKAEAAQKAYNDRSNEFRQALDDQSKTFMTKPEYVQQHASLSQAVDVLRNTTVLQRDDLRNEVLSIKEDLRKEISNTKEEMRKDIVSINKTQAVEEGTIETKKSFVRDAVTIILAVVAILVSAGCAILVLFFPHP